MRMAWTACACVAALSLAAPARAEQRDPTPLKEASRPSPFIELTRASWYSVNELVLASARKMPEEHYEYRPTDGVRTFAQILTHIAMDHHATCGPVTGRAMPNVNADKLKTKEAVSTFLQESSALCDMAYGMLTTENAGFLYRALDGQYSRAALLVSNITHDSEHYGTLVAYMTLKGVEPPSSDH